MTESRHAEAMSEEIVNGWPCQQTGEHDVHTRPGNVYEEPYNSTVVAPWLARRSERMARFRLPPREVIVDLATNRIVDKETGQ